LLIKYIFTFFQEFAKIRFRKVCSCDRLTKGPPGMSA